MARYRKISPCIWNDAKVRGLSDKGKLTLFLLLTHPNMTSLGALRANLPGLPASLAGRRRFLPAPSASCWTAAWPGRMPTRS